MMLVNFLTHPGRFAAQVGIVGAIGHAGGDQTITVTTPVTVTLNPAVLARG